MAQNGALDETDRRILAHLARNGRATYEEIGQAIGLRRPSVHERVKKLEARGVLKGYRAELDPHAVGAELVAFVTLKIEPCSGPNAKDCYTRCEEVAERLKRLPEVLEFHTIAGEEDALVKLRVGSIRDLERLVMRELSGTPHVQGVTTKVVLRTHFERGLTLDPKATSAVVARRR